MKLLAIAAIVVLGSGYTVTRMNNAAKPVELRASAAREGIVTILIPNGVITLEGWREDEIVVTGTIDNDDADITLTSDHGHAELRLEGNDLTVGANLHVRVPQHSNLDIETEDAHFTIKQFAGMLRFESAGGDLIVHEAPRAVIARSVTGDIEISAPNVAGFAHSEEGRVRVRSVTGDAGVARDRWHRQGVRDTHGRSRTHSNVHADVSSLISDAFRDANVAGLIDFDHVTGRLEFDIAGNVYINLDYLGDIFYDVSDLLREIENDISHEMGQLGRELENIGADIRRQRR